ncbi:MAG: ATP-binding protein [Ignavibacteria bacterium]|nr:ATP-binding protein [Ignavibacteria bacterium]
MKSTSRTFRLTLRSNPKQIRRVEGLLKRVSEVIPLNEIQMHKLMVAVTEAANNAIIHGNRMDPEKVAKVTCEVAPPWITFVITDQGGGFNPETVSSPLEEENLLKASGRGIFLMKTLMDKVDYQVGPTGSRVELRLNVDNE